MISRVRENSEVVRICPENAMYRENPIFYHVFIFALLGDGKIHKTPRSSRHFAQLRLQSLPALNAQAAK